MDGGSHCVDQAPAVVHEHTTSRFHDFLHRVGHVQGHLPLVLADAVIDVRERNAVAVDARLAHRDPVVGVREHLAVRVHLEPGRMPRLDLLLERCAEAGDGRRQRVRTGDAGAGVPELHAEAAQVVTPAPRPVIEARHVDVLPSDAAVVASGRPGQRGKVPDRVQADLLAEIAPDDVRPVADAVGVRGGCGVQQDACGIHATGADDDNARQNLALRPGAAVEVLHPARKPVLSGEDTGHHGIRDDFEASGLLCEGQQVIRGTEERRRVAARAAVSAVVACGEPTGRTRHVGAPAGHDRDVELSHALLQQALAAPRSRRRLQKFAAGQGIGIVGAAAHANHLLDPVVVGRNVRIGDRPRDLPPVTIRRLEVELGVPETHPPPDVRLPAMPPHARELERAFLRRVVRLLLRVEEKVRRPLAACAPLPRFPWLHVRPVPGAIELLPRIQQQHVDSLSSQVPGSHAA